ncbi:MAG: hypothetical protein HC880_16685 [Bacteroidia bacterium]|nr:hypothetical protein [Bacteroidia bacterium]
MNQLVESKKRALQEDIKRTPGKENDKKKILDDKLNEYENKRKSRNIATLLAINHKAYSIYNNFEWIQKIQTDIANFTRLNTP